MKRFPIPASPQDPNPKKRFKFSVTVILPDEFGNEYGAEGKEFPDTLPTDWDDPSEKDPAKRKKPIDWISNFGLSKDRQLIYELPEGTTNYRVLLPRLTNKRYVYFDGTEVKELTTEPSESDPSFLEAIYRLADPPTGMT